MSPETASLSCHTAAARFAIGVPVSIALLLHVTR
jgi:hypothetical protein